MSLLKLNKHNVMSMRTMKKYTKKLLRKTDLPDYTTFTCLNYQDCTTCLKNQAYKDHILKLSEVIDLLLPSKKLRLKAGSKS